MKMQHQSYISYKTALMYSDGPTKILARAADMGILVETGQCVKPGWLFNALAHPLLGFTVCRDPMRQAWVITQEW